MLSCKGRTLLHRVFCPLSWSGSLSSAIMKPRNCVSRGRQCCTIAGVRLATEEFAAVRHSTVKRKVAVHFGYVGTGFRGLQFQRNSSNDRTIEEVLERGIAAAGGILPSNIGYTHKTGWSRNSRTDKGVHSLSTVAALKLESVDGCFERDPEGLELAAAVNRHLPEQVRVFSVQRTHSAFHARQQCRDRTYCYHLPAAALGLTGCAEDAVVLERLSACLQLFQGVHPFHNYTERRRYRTKARQKQKSAAQATWQALHRNAGRPPAAADIHGASPRPEPAPPHSFQSGAGTASRQSHAGAVAGSLDSDHQQPLSAGLETSDQGGLANELTSQESQAADGDGDREEEEEVEAPLISMKPLLFRWLHETNEQDMVTHAHYRNILHASASQPRPLTPTGQPCVTITLQGASFMVYQIRHMVAVAACVARGLLPLDFVAASLSPHVRTTLPLAPPSTLVLADSAFFGFPRIAGTEPHPVCSLSGPALSLRAGGRRGQEDFCSQVLHPAVDSLLGGQAWQQWASELTAKAQYSPLDMQALVGAYSEWLARKEERRQIRSSDS